jgi:hypothetical protein
VYIAPVLLEPAGHFTLNYGTVYGADVPELSNTAARGKAIYKTSSGFYVGPMLSSMDYFNNAMYEDNTVSR